MTRQARAPRQVPRPDDAARVAATAAHIAWTKRGRDVAVIRIDEILPVAAYFVLATGNNRRHTRTIAETIQRAFRKLGISRLGFEGFEDGRWILLDYGEVVIHVLQEAEREFYDLDHLWHGAPHEAWEGIEKLPVDPDLLGGPSRAGGDEEDETF